jgi:hypothetical protein
MDQTKNANVEALLELAPMKYKFDKPEHFFDRYVGCTEDPFY